MASFLQIQVIASGAGTVDFGRVRVYHSREPLPYATQFATDPTDKIGTLTDGATVTPDVSSASYLKLTAAATPRTIAAPITASGSTNGLIIGMRRTFDILNSSGGALVTTWNPAYKLAGAWVDPANTKRRKIQFTWDGTNWVEDYRTAADI